MALLKEYAGDAAPEVADTCQLALQSLVRHQGAGADGAEESRYLSVDPAPPANASEKDIPELEAKLLVSHPGQSGPVVFIFSLERWLRKDPLVHLLSSYFLSLSKTRCLILSCLIPTLPLSFFSLLIQL